MLVYRVKNDTVDSDIVWAKWEDAIEEIKSFFEWELEDTTEPNTITLSIEEMTQEGFDALPEFAGY